MGVALLEGVFGECNPVARHKSAPYRSGMTRPIALLLLPAVLAGCTADLAGYPSLAPRPVEKTGFDEPVTAPPAPVAVDAALDTRLADIERQRVAAAARFDAAAGRAEALADAARGSRAGSEAWLDAQTALAALDGARAEHRTALGMIEDLAAARAEALEPAYPGIETALVAARATDAEQTRRIDTIAGSLAPA